jgi:hypothetical protein
MEGSFEIVLFAAFVLLSEIHSLCFFIESINSQISPFIIFGMYTSTLKALLNIFEVSPPFIISFICSSGEILGSTK